jgi:hypothetical protein
MMQERASRKYKTYLRAPDLLISLLLFLSRTYNEEVLYSQIILKKIPRFKNRNILQMCWRRIYLYGTGCTCVYYAEPGPVECESKGECGHEDWYALPEEGGCIPQYIVELHECPKCGPPKTSVTQTWKDLPPYDDDDDEYDHYHDSKNS